MTSLIQMQIQTMSSREIATLCQKSHDNVLKLVRSLIEGGIVKSTTPHQYIHPQNGQTYTEYLSDKRDSLVIVARLSPEFTAADGLGEMKQADNGFSQLMFTTKGEAWIVERLISEEVV